MAYMAFYWTYPIISNPPPQKKKKVIYFDLKKLIWTFTKTGGLKNRTLVDPPPLIRYMSPITSIFLRRPPLQNFQSNIKQRGEHCVADQLPHLRYPIRYTRQKERSKVHNANFIKPRRNPVHLWSSARFYETGCILVVLGTRRYILFAGIEKKEEGGGIQS